jgi:hypothetical protein
MAVFEAVEKPFPRGLPERFVAALSVRVVGGGWLVRLSVRPGMDRALRHLAEEWALREVLQFRAGGTESSQRPEHVDPERLLVMREYATLEDLPEARAGRS